jgi:hypothetical protein
MSNTTDVEQFNIYGYDPNRPLAYACTAIFAVLCVAVGIINIRHKSWFFIVIPIASAMEVVGFAIRPDAAFDVGKYIVTTLCILLAPTVYAMADYALVSRMYGYQYQLLN